MRRIELRYCTPVFKDGLSGAAAVNQPATVPVATDDSLTIDNVVLNTVAPAQVPVGARFTIDGETDPTAVHVVVTRTPADAGPTTAVTFAPALGAGTYAKTAVLTFQAQELEVSIGDGDRKYSENNQYKYDLDRGQLDTVRDGDEVPMDVNMNFTWAYTKSGTGEPISPEEAIKGIGAAAEWVSTGAPCEPYAVDLEIRNVPKCAAQYKETYLFPMFRAEKRDHDFKNANVAVNGKCNATEPVITRG